MKIDLKETWERIPKIIKTIGTIATGIGAVLGLAFLIEDRIKTNAAEIAEEAILRRGKQRCVIIPSNGHYVEPGSPGEWTKIHIYGVQRLRDDCGVASITANISNGNRIWHRAELSIAGRALTVGTHNLSYLVFIDEETSPGAAVLEITTSFPDAVGGNQSPGPLQIPFTILPRDGENNEEP